jgi:hypothetical protein
MFVRKGAARGHSAGEGGTLSSRLGIAAQAVAVVALAVVVYLAFLKPNDSDPLSEIQVDDGADVEASSPPSHHRERERPHAGTKKRERRGKPRVTEAGLPAALEPSTAGVDTPVGSQYVSAVTRISEQATRASH